MTKTAQELAWVYVDKDGTVVYRAFSIGDCLRSLVACRLGETPTPPQGFLRQAITVSADLENDAIDEYRKRTGHPVIWQQKTVEYVVQEDGPPIVIRGHIDGLDQQDDHVLEVKWLSGKNFDKYLDHGLDGLGSLGEKYQWQGGFYGGALQRDVRYVIGNKAWMPGHPEDELLLIDPPVPAVNLKPMETIRDRVLEVEEWAARDELPECDRNCSTSSFMAHVHEFESESGYLADDELAGLIQQAWELRVVLEGDPDNKEDVGLLGKYNDLKDRIKELAAPGIHMAGNLSAQIVKSKGSQRVDTKALKRNHPEVYEDCLTLGAPSTRIILKRNG